MSGESDTRGAIIRERARVHVPLNSKRLMAGQLRCLAVALEVPSSGASADIRLIIEGKLIELGREPHNVQVVIDEGTPMAALDLQDESGTFLTVLAEDPVDSEHAGDTVESEHETSEEDDNEENVSSLKQALEEAIQQK